jgi:hypothetical protein
MKIDGFQYFSSTKYTQMRKYIYIYIYVNNQIRSQAFVHCPIENKRTLTLNSWSILDCNNMIPMLMKAVAPSGEQLSTEQDLN